MDWYLNYGCDYTDSMAGVRSRLDSGFSLMEVLMSMVLLQLMIIPIFLILSGLNHHFAKTYMHEEGLYWARRNMEAVTHMGQTNWEYLQSQPLNTELYLEQQGGSWVFKNGKYSQPDSEFSSWIVIKQACVGPDYQLRDCTDPSASPNSSLRSISAYSNWLYRSRLQEIQLDTVISEVF